MSSTLAAEQLPANTVRRSTLLLSTVCRQSEQEAMRSAAGQHLREQNQLLVLNVIRVEGRPTRRRLAEVTGLTFQSIENISRRLIDAGIVADVPPIGSERSRRLTLRPDGAHALGIHRTANAWQITVCDLTGHTVAEEMLTAVDPGNPPAELRRVARAVADLMDDQGIPLNTVVGVGVTYHLSNGPEYDDRAARSAVSEEFRTLLRIPNIRMGTPTHAALRREQWSGRLTARDAIFVHLADEVGCAIVSSGQLTRGATGNSGNIAHFAVEPAGRLCQCGRIGCLTTVLSTAGLARLVGDDYRRTLRPTLTEIAELAATDQNGARVVDRAAQFLVRALAPVVQLLDPAVVIISGPTAQALGETFLEATRIHLGAMITTADLPTVAMSGMASGPASAAANTILHHVFTPAVKPRGSE